MSQTDYQKNVSMQKYEILGKIFPAIYSTHTKKYIPSAASASFLELFTFYNLIITSTVILLLRWPAIITCHLNLLHKILTPVNTIMIPDLQSSASKTIVSGNELSHMFYQHHIDNKHMTTVMLHYESIGGEHGQLT
jgi:hypothetical protein